MEKLAAAGIENPWQVLSYTPREISLFLQAHQARERKRQQQLWLLSRYVALAVHAPEKLPPPPADLLPDMTDEEMKQRLLAWRGKEE